MTHAEFAKVGARPGDWLLIDSVSGRGSSKEVYVIQFAGIVKVDTESVINGQYKISNCRSIEKFITEQLRKMIAQNKKL